MSSLPEESTTETNTNYISKLQHPELIETNKMLKVNDDDDDDDDVTALGALVEEFFKQMPADNSQADACSSDTSPSDCQKKTVTNEELFVQPIQSVPKTHQPVFVFYLAAEVLQFRRNHQPANSLMQLAGKVEYCDAWHSYIISDQEAKLKVDFGEESVFPNVSDDICLFCQLTFVEEKPLVVASFFRRLSVPYKEYLDLMLKLRPAVPTDNFKMITGSDLEEEPESETEELENEIQELGNGIEQQGNKTEELANETLSQVENMLAKQPFRPWVLEQFFDEWLAKELAD